MKVIYVEIICKKKSQIIRNYKVPNNSQINNKEDKLYEKTNQRSWGGGTLIIRQSSGIFYEVNDNDAIILNYLFNYKITGSNRVGFPNTALSKVLNTLEKDNIDYILYYINGTKDEYHKVPNNYNKVLTLALSNYDFNNKIKDITSKINKLDNIKLNNLLKIIEDYLNE